MLWCCGAEPGLRRESAMTMAEVYFFFNETATTEIYTLSLHDALPICQLLAVHLEIVGIILLADLGIDGGGPEASHAGGESGRAHGRQDEQRAHRESADSHVKLLSPYYTGGEATTPGPEAATGVPSGPGVVLRGERWLSQRGTACISLRCSSASFAASNFTTFRS